MNLRLDEVHEALLEKMVEKLNEQKAKTNQKKTNKTDVIQKAIYSFAKNHVLEQKIINEIIDKHYMEP